MLWFSSCAKEQSRPPAPPKPPLELIGEWGTGGDGPGQLSRPVSLAADFAGNIYIADAGSKYVHKFDPAGKPLLSFQDVSLKSPGGIAVDRGGGIYVTDTDGNQLLIFKPDGVRFARIRRAADGQLSNPSGVAVAPDGTFYVADLDGIRVTRYGGSLNPAESWRLPGESPAPKGTRTDVAVGDDGNLYATDPRALMVHHFGPGELGNGRQTAFLADIPNPGGSSLPNAGLAVSGRLVFLADGESARLLAWSLDGKLVLNTLFPGETGGNQPIADVAWSPRGELFLLDPVTPRVLRFRVHL